MRGKGVYFSLMLMFLVLLIPVAFAQTTIIDDFETGVVSGWSSTQPASPLVIANGSNDFVISGNFSAKGSGTDGTQLEKGFTAQNNGTFSFFINLNATTAYKGLQLSIRDSNNVGTSKIGIRISNASNANIIFTTNGSTAIDTGVPITLGIHKFSVTKFPNATIITEWDDVELFRGKNNFLFIINRFFIDVNGIAQGGFSIFYIDNLTRQILEATLPTFISTSISDTDPFDQIIITLSATCNDEFLNGIILENNVTGSFVEVASLVAIAPEDTLNFDHTTALGFISHRFICTDDSFNSITSGLLNYTGIVDPTIVTGTTKTLQNLGLFGLTSGLVVLILVGAAAATFSKKGGSKAKL